MQAKDSGMKYCYGLNCVRKNLFVEVLNPST